MKDSILLDFYQNLFAVLIPREFQVQLTWVWTWDIFMGICLTSVGHLQVIEWLDNHGEVFLSKNMAVGKSAVKANALHKNHEHFETVAQVSFHYDVLPRIMTARSILCCAHCWDGPHINQFNLLWLFLLVSIFLTHPMSSGTAPFTFVCYSVAWDTICKQFPHRIFR